jgi:uncharacterized protein YndB with AHSA1/START domain
MTMNEAATKPNSPLELAVERYIDAPPSTVYIGGWTTVANQLAALAQAAARA